MDYKIQLYRGVDRKLFGSLPFMDVVQQSLERLLGRDLTKTNILITVLNVPEDITFNSTPVVENLIPEFGYTYVKVYLGGYLMYQHPHPLADIISQTLQENLKKQYPEETYWGYRLDIPGIPQIYPGRPAPSVQGGVLIEPFVEGAKPLFGIKRISEPEPPEKSLFDFVAKPGLEHRSARVKALLPKELEKDLLYQRALSSEFEEGGFLIGRPYREEGVENAYLIEITDAVPANYTGASFLHFTFTGDSFIEIKQSLRQNRPDERLLGWYHTHLFPATSEFGLSSIDLTLHFGTFTIPWQLAGLINIDGNKRVLRFYIRQGNEMACCPYWTIDERY